MHDVTDSPDQEMERTTIQEVITSEVTVSKRTIKEVFNSKGQSLRKSEITVSSNTPVYYQSIIVLHFVDYFQVLIEKNKLQFCFYFFLKRLYSSLFGWKVAFFIFFFLNNTLTFKLVDTDNYSLKRYPN